jgi:bacillithiol system protein YtxJ
MTPVPTPQAFDAWRSRPGYSWLLKHSRTCPVSAAAHAEVSAYERTHARDAVGIIVVQDNRAASDRVAAAWKVKHESPQLFLVKDGKPIWHASHGEITQDAMEMQRLPAL